MATLMEGIEKLGSRGMQEAQALYTFEIKEGSEIFNAFMYKAMNERILMGTREEVARMMELMEGKFNLREWPSDHDSIGCNKCGHVWEWDWCGDTITSREIVGLYGVGYHNVKPGIPTESKCVCGEVLAIMMVSEDDDEFLGLYITEAAVLVEDREIDYSIRYTMDEDEEENE